MKKTVFILQVIAFQVGAKNLFLQSASDGTDGVVDVSQLTVDPTKAKQWEFENEADVARGDINIKDNNGDIILGGQLFNVVPFEVEETQSA